MVTPANNAPKPPKPASWRVAKQKGAYRLIGGRHELWRGEERLCIAAQLPSGLWYWYGDGVNTSSRPASLEVVKEEASAHFESKNGAKPAGAQVYAPIVQAP